MDRRKTAITLWWGVAFLFALSTACDRRLANNSNANGAPSSTLSPSPTSSGSPTSTPAIAAEEPEFDAAGWLAGKKEGGETHAVIIASMEPSRTLARHEPDTVINPASLVKLATSLTALRKLGRDFRFEVRVLASGVLRDNGSLEGDLYFDGIDPVFTAISAKAVADELRQRGIRRISGKVLVSPKFSFDFSAVAAESAKLLAEQLGLERTPKSGVSQSPAGTEIFVFRSQPLYRILLYQNTFSSNFVAHRIGEQFGGAEFVRRFLTKELKLPESEVELETTSGLGQNGMTARGIFAVMRELDRELRRQDLELADIMPVVGEDYSTLERRLTGSKFERAIVAKTGTLSARDGGPGIASLAGIVNTASGPVVFVIMSNGKDIFRYKEMQDDLLRAVLDENFDPDKYDISLPRDLLQRSETQIEQTGELRRAER